MNSALQHGGEGDERACPTHARPIGTTHGSWSGEHAQSEVWLCCASTTSPAMLSTVPHCLAADSSTTRTRRHAVATTLVR
eukprot:6488430-Amphidinium_carterae.3